MPSCYICPSANFKTAGALRQHHTIQHKQPLACVELTCPAYMIEHAYGDSMCGYTFDPVEGIAPKEPIKWNASHKSKANRDTDPTHLEYPAAL